MKTKNDWINHCLVLGTENQGLRKENSALRTTVEALHATPEASNDPCYPLIDSRGRTYRLEGRVRCYPASH